MSPLDNALEPGDHAQRRGLAAARRTQEGDELALADVEVEADHGRRAIVVGLADPDQLQILVQRRSFRHLWTGLLAHPPIEALSQALRNSSHFWIRRSYSSGH